MQITVVYSPGPSTACVVYELDLPVGATVLEALHASTIYRDYPETQSCTVGIFASVVSLEQMLCAGDRIEVYRPLQEDPKLARQRRVKSVG
jgi:uncharacterized protein